MKITAFFGGGDWYDASVDHLVLPDGLDLNAERQRYKTWYDDEYCKIDSQYLSFVGWLESRCGARRPTDEELEIVDD